MRYRKAFLLGVIYLLGLFSGITLNGFLSMKASRVYLDIIRTNYIQEQERLGDESFKEGKYLESIRYYRNAIQALSKKDIQSLNPDKSFWSFWFPFVAIMLNEIRLDSECNNRASTFMIGIYHGKLGMVLERLDKIDEAENEYRIATELTGIKDIERIKKFVRNYSGLEIRNVDKKK